MLGLHSVGRVHAFMPKALGLVPSTAQMSVVVHTVIPAPRSRGRSQKFQVILSYILSLRPA